MSKTNTLFLTEPHYEANNDVFTAELHLTVNDVTVRVGHLHIDNHGVILNVSPDNMQIITENTPVTNQLHLSSFVTTALSDAYWKLDQNNEPLYIDCFQEGDVIVLKMINHKGFSGPVLRHSEDFKGGIGGDSILELWQEAEDYFRFNVYKPGVSDETIGTYDNLEDAMEGLSDYKAEQEI